ncbi:hypothetical protein E4U17_000060 [Claviceps sp. LM77 group G4]|nr:hypothetical protein E4U17_000060 [Claviceps sp. LM77 group G4]
MSDKTDVRDAEFKKFLTQRSLLMFQQWAAKRETEHDKYSEIVQRLQARDRDREDAEKRVVKERAAWAIRSRYFTPQRRRACKEIIDAFFAIADQVQLARGERVDGDAKFEDFLKNCAEQSTSLFKWYWIRLGDRGDEDSREMRVYNTLDHVRYYFGNPGGKYIFRHTEQIPSYYDMMFPEGMNDDPWHEYLNINHNDRRDTYSFCGLVPRTIQEYIARFEIVCPKVVQLLGSLLLFEDSCSQSANDKLDSFTGTVTSVTSTQLLELYNGWVALAKSPNLSWAQKQARSHHLVLECAYLLGSIEGQQKGFMANPMIALFSDTLQLAAGTNFGCLVDEYAKLVAEEGFDELLERKNLDSCILISSKIEEDIHDFFNAPGFTVDPLHPSRRFRHLHVQPALDKVDALIHQEAKSLDPQGSDSSLSGPPDSDPGPDPDHPSSGQSANPPAADSSTHLSSGDSANPPAADSSTIAFYHPTDPAVPEHWDPLYPGYVGGRFRSEADNDNHLEEEEVEQLNANNKRIRAQPTQNPNPIGKQQNAGDKMVSLFSLRTFFGRPLSIVTATTNTTNTITTTTRKLLFSTSATAMARVASKPGAGGKPGAAAKSARKNRTVPKSENSIRVQTLRKNMFSRAPPPLRMGRLRHLRHWTIHRAWQIFQRAQREATSKERQRMHAGMHSACEELRKSIGPEGRSEGYLYRVAMAKEGVWGTSAIPIEYVRYQTEYPGEEPWKHDWKKD